jgi:large subunit ribosomal protein L25
METLKLSAQIREKHETQKDLTANKQVAWIVYGKKTENIMVKLDYSDFLKTFRKSWESHIIELDIDGKKVEVLVYDVQKAPVSGDFIHIDFYAITKGEKVYATIPLVFVWASQAVREWAIIEEHVKEIEVKCLPKDLVDNFEVNLSKLSNVWDILRVSDLEFDKQKYEVSAQHAEDVVVSATLPAKVEEIPTGAPVAPEAPTAIKAKEKVEETKDAGAKEKKK